LIQILDFHRTLTEEQRKLSDAIILFSVKDKDYFGMANQYVADAFMMFKDIADTNSDSGSIQQMHLKLTRPQNEGETLDELQKSPTNFSLSPLRNHGIHQSTSIPRR
jgi:hypothetical protein